ncbi:hypothetical protein EBU71_22380, partial [bacterium]|nr:hypothetical protein [Candidatus Elulimicrobium humile]
DAKLGEVILPSQKKAVIQQWGEKWLDLETIEPTENIKQGKWKLSEEDKIEVLGEFFSVDLKAILNSFKSIPEKFNEVIKKSIDLDLLGSENPNYKLIMNNFDITKPTINQISLLTTPIFKKIAVGESQSEEVIVRDDNGRPVMDDNGRPTKRRRDEGEIIFSKNLVNINGFVSDFNTLFPESRIDAYRFSQGDIPQLINISKEDFSSYNYVVEVDLYGKDMFLSIQHNPKDILNMSVSRFYGSCQHLYSGGYRNKLLGNVFDPNSIPAFIIFDSPIYHRDELISEQLPLCRRIIRNSESADGSHKIYFDRAYTDRMEEVMKKMIEKYSNNKHSGTDKYVFSPDIPIDDTTYELDSPYMDRLQVERGYFIG